MSIITLFLNGSPAPSTFAVGSQSLLSARIDGSVPASVEWSYGLRYGQRTTGQGDILFQPVNAEPYYLHILAYKADGTSAESIFILSVTSSGTSAASVTIIWKDPAPVAAGPNSAVIAISGVVPPRSVAWSHYFNGVVFSTGHGQSVPLGSLQPGIHRIFATVVDHEGNTVVGDSSIHVRSAFGLQAAVTPPQPISSSMVLLGSVYSPVIEGSAALATSLPFALASLDRSVRLLPGTTHFAVDLDPELNTVDDEVVVRSQLGNWTLKGPPTGLTDETLPYDYQHGQPIQPAPLDLSTRYGIDVWNVHGADVSPYKFRVRFRCFKSGDAVYRYEPCPWSNYSGGTGERQRRLVAVVTKVDLHLDAESPQNRGRSSDVEMFTTQSQGYIRGTFDSTGKPDQPLYTDDHFYTDQNNAAVYESGRGLKDIVAYGVYGMPSVRPAILDFSQPGQPRIVNRPKRLWGKLVIYLSGGALNQGTVVTARIYTGKQPGYVDVPVTVTQNVYNPDYSGFIRAGEGAIDIEDFEFSRLGVMMDLTIDESSVGTAVPSIDPMMTVGEDFYYTKINSPAIKIDTACFKDPVLQTIFEGTFLGSASALTSCNVLSCGPIGTYCYVQTAGTGTLTAFQPLGFPAPFIAPYGDEANCYSTPTFLGEWLGERTTVSSLVHGYSGTTGCGVAYQYNPCSIAVQQQLAVVFPTAATPHPAISYQGYCYTLIGSVQDTRLLTSLAAADVSPVTGCTDVVCTGSNGQGDALDYIDMETLQQVTVSFPHMDSGFPHFGVAPEKVSQGYGLTPPGSMKWELWHTPVFAVMTAPEDAELNFTVTPSNIWREIVVNHNGNRQHYRFYPGLDRGTISVSAGDIVTLEFGNRLKQYRGLSGQVSWQKPVALPYLYDTGTLLIVPTTGTLKALGFCGLSNRQDYCFFGTLGATVAMDLPNPDAVVTVKDNSSLPEMVLVRTKQPNEVDYTFNMPSYQAERLRSPLIFKFYAGRNRVGAHGEMDVWMVRDNTTFPEYFKVSEFKALQKANYAYRKLSQQTDTSRRGLRVTTSALAMDMMSPRIHVDDRGRRISVVTDDLNDYVFEGVQPYTWIGEYDTGISETIYRDLEPGGGPDLAYLHSVPARPRGLCYVSSQDEVWVANSTSNMLTILFGDGSNIAQTIVGVTGVPYGVTYCEDTDCVAVGCQSGEVKLYDVATRTLVTTLTASAIPFWNFEPVYASYNPVTRNIYVVGAPSNIADWVMYEVDPRTNIVTQFPFGTGLLSMADMFYCSWTGETIVATESGGSFAFNVNTKAFENLGVPGSSCQGAAAAPELTRILFTSAANPPGGINRLYDPRSRSLVRSFAYDYPVRGTGWHPKRRKFYLSTLSIYLGGPGVGVMDVNGNRLSTINNYDWSWQWVYSPVSRLMFTSIPATFYSNNYVGVYT